MSDVPTNVGPTTKGGARGGDVLSDTDGLVRSVTLSEYEEKEWDRLQQRKADALSKKARYLLPTAARDRVSTAVDPLRHTPGVDVAAEAYADATTGLGKIIGGAASHTVSTESVVKQFQEAGHEITTLSNIHYLDLEAVDSVARLTRVRWGHSGSAALSGLASGAAITGAGVLVTKGTVAGEGAKKAPGFGVVATAFAADVAVVLGLAARTVASTARYYGYDPRQPEEQVFMMSVIGLGMATGTPAKTAAYAELSQLAQLLFRNASWEKLSEKALTRIASSSRTSSPSISPRRSSASSYRLLEWSSAQGSTSRSSTALRLPPTTPTENASSSKSQAGHSPVSPKALAPPSRSMRAPSASSNCLKKRTLFRPSTPTTPRPQRTGADPTKYRSRTTGDPSRANMS